MAAKGGGRGQVKARRRRDNLSTYGPSRLTCGSEVCGSSWIILVEGRADVRRLSLSGYHNSLEIDGARIDPSIREICDSKDKVVAFLDGDRSGELIMRTLRRSAAGP